ncbi:hypothetical protein FK498_09415 [Elioraea sp. Yellowstone]|uniref:hypothetical protein n=1 Tax=Elioraea sp. Yellowstone TaxID=2592070 RepID=UPI00114DE1BB|nr:hypothetical protein [Elioraea sp. Yellowstone]TQF78344.1 hypothetical protein FK498_09415 [Elioraea sp. Yellowstone]
MRRAVLLALAAAACGATVDLAPPEGVAADDPRVAACRAEAEATPERREIARRAAPGIDAEQRTRREIERAVVTAYHACLQRAGFARVGGVEAVQPPLSRWWSPGAPPALPDAGRVPLAPPAPTGY